MTGSAVEEVSIDIFGRSLPDLRKGLRKWQEITMQAIDLRSSSNTPQTLFWGLLKNIIHAFLGSFEDYFACQGSIEKDQNQTYVF